jgi:hypothetical protein
VIEGLGGANVGARGFTSPKVIVESIVFVVFDLSAL